MSAPGAMRILSYNMHKGIGGVDRRYRPERIAAVIKRLKADVVLLQEVDEGATRSSRHRQVDELADRLGFEHRAFHPNVTLREGHYGNALLSRWPLDHDENIDLTYSIKKRRGALHARLWVPTEGGQTRVWIYNVHLGLAAIERRAQVKRLLAWNAHHHPGSDAAVVIAGDFNDFWGRLGRAFLEPAGFTSSPLTCRTFPAWAPVRPLDRCYVLGPARITHSYVTSMQLARSASDHLPLVTDVDFGAAAPP